MKRIREGGFVFYASSGKISSEMPVFYNPEKVFDRDLCINLMKIYRPEKVCDLLSASGIRGIRIGSIKGVKEVYLNDRNRVSANIIRKNVSLNKKKISADVFVSNTGANKFLCNNKIFFDYIDIDPFGTPNPFLESGITFLKNKKIMGVTATDSSALTGSYKNACRRKYGSYTHRTSYMKETGLRILIKHIIMKGAQQEKALSPVFSYNLRDYYRIYFKCRKGAKKCDKLMSKIKYVYHCSNCLYRDEYELDSLPKKCPECSSIGLIIGSLWTGRLWCKKLLNNINMDDKIINYIKKESGIKKNGFYETNNVYRKEAPKINKIISFLEEKGFKASRTHFSPTGIKTDADIKDFY